MSIHNKNGTASLSKSQRRSFQQFKKRNLKNLKDIPVTTLVQLWRDGFIVGAIHGWDQAVKLRQRQAPGHVAAQKKRVKARK